MPSVSEESLPSLCSHPPTSPFTDCQLYDSVWETLAQRRKIAHIWALFKAYTAEEAWKSAGDRLKGPCYLSRDDHDCKIRARKQRTDISKYSFIQGQSNCGTNCLQRH